MNGVQLTSWQALKEGNDILDEKIEAKSFNNVDDFIEDVIK